MLCFVCAYIGEAWLTDARPAYPPTMNLSPDVCIEFLEDGPRFLGLGSIAIGGVPLRGSRRPMFVELRTPCGLELFDFQITRRIATEGRLTLECSMQARSAGLQEWMVHAVRPRRVTRDWAEPVWRPAATLCLHLRELTESFAGRTFRGFEYSYEYASDECPIYRLLDRSSWALGEALAGNTFWLRNSFSPSVLRFAEADEFYSTEWYLGNIANPNIFQFQPFQTNLESFTMLTSERGQLLTLARRVAHIRSLFEKPRGTDEILHWHEHCGDLTRRFSTTPVQVLFCDQPATPVDLINLHGAVRERVAEDLHREAGLRRERITTYGVIEEWTRPDLGDYAARILPRLLSAGVKCVFLPNQFQNNLNVWNVPNMCCTLDYLPPGPVEAAALRRFCDLAQAFGAVVQMWGSTALSTLALLLPAKKGALAELIDHATDPFVRNPSGAIEADHYTPHFAVLNLRDPAVLAYWRACWREARDQLGLGGCFLDSSFNLTSDKFHFTHQPARRSAPATADQTDLLGHVRPAHEPPPAILSMYRAHLDLVAWLQGCGYHYCGEDVGVFGLHRGGPNLVRRLPHLFLWSDCYLDFDRAAVLEAGFLPDDIFFRGLAYRLMWILYWNFTRQTLSWAQRAGSPEDDPTPGQVALLRAFHEVEAAMLHRTVLTDERGVLYESERRHVLWTFTAFSHPLPPEVSVREILTGRTPAGATLLTGRNQVYAIDFP